MWSLFEFCPICGARSTGAFEPCDGCRIRMEKAVREECSLCASSLAGSDDPCPSCRNSPPKALDGLKTCGPWAGCFREWLSSLKYGGDARMAEYPAKLLVRRWIEDWEGIPVVPVPPRPSRIFRQGFDPVGQLAFHMQKGGVPLAPVLKRTGGRAQKELDRSARLRGDALHYHLHHELPVQGGTYVLLDDVTTTGATLDLCAGILKDHGARRVFGLVFCRD